MPSWFLPACWSRGPRSSAPIGPWGLEGRGLFSCTPRAVCPAGQRGLAVIFPHTHGWVCSAWWRLADLGNSAPGAARTGPVSSLLRLAAPAPRCHLPGVREGTNRQVPRACLGGDGGSPSRLSELGPVFLYPSHCYFFFPGWIFGFFSGMTGQFSDSGCSHSTRQEERK